MADLKAQLEEMQDLIEARDQDISAYKARSEELAQHVERLVEEVQRERATRERLEGDLANAEKEHDAALRAEQRSLEAKESALQSALNDLARTQSLLTQRETDIAQVQSALETLEAESKKFGESHTTPRFSLQLEVDRLKRDLKRLGDDLSRARKDLGDRERRGRERDSVIDKLHAENCELASKLENAHFRAPHTTRYIVPKAAQDRRHRTRRTASLRENGTHSISSSSARGRLTQISSNRCAVGRSGRH